MNATEPQVRLLMALLEECGYGIQWVDAGHARFPGAEQNVNRSVEGWLHQLSPRQASGMINQLKEEKL